METIINIARFLRDVFYKAPDEDRSRKLNYELSEKVSFRCTKEERVLMEKYCQLRKVDISEYLRVLNHNHITEFIIEYDAENEYYKSLENKKKFKKVS